MIKTNLLNESVNRSIAETLGKYSVLVYDRDLTLRPSEAVTAYYSSMCDIHKRQVVAKLSDDSVICQAGAMQLMIGNVTAKTDVKGAGDLFKKAIGSKVTGETAIKPMYDGNGLLVLEPTYKHILLEDLSNWNGSVVLEDGMFLACDSSIKLSVSARQSLSSAVLGNEGLFNTKLSGTGIAVLESPVPREELIVVDLDNDTIKIDGSMAIAWSDSLSFTVEKTTKTIIGSAASGEGLVNVYRGSGRILMAPVS